MRLLALILFYIQFQLNLSETVRSNICNKDAEIKDYYWREYSCVIPKDAVPGGTHNGNTTYIGQVLHQNQIIPAEIDLEEGVVVYELGRVAFFARINTKILCSTNKKQFEWVTTGSGLINTIKDKHFVVGGFEPNPSITLLIGRKFINDDFVIGKVLFTNDVSVLVTTEDGKGIHHREFDVLTYRDLKQEEQKD